ALAGLQRGRFRHHGRRGAAGRRPRVRSSAGGIAGPRLRPFGGVGTPPGAPPRRPRLVDGLIGRPSAFGGLGAAARSGTPRPSGRVRGARSRWGAGIETHPEGRNLESGRPAMVLQEASVDLTTATGPMRTDVYRP